MATAKRQAGSVFRSSARQALVMLVLTLGIIYLPPFPPRLCHRRILFSQTAGDPEKTLLRQEIDILKR